MRWGSHIAPSRQQLVVEHCRTGDEAFIYGLDYHPGPSGLHSNSSCLAEKRGPGALKINVPVQIAGLNKTSDTAMIAA